MMRCVHFLGLLSTVSSLTLAQAQNPVWIKRHNAPNGDDAKANAIAVDASGNAYVTGYIVDGIDLTWSLTTIKYSESGLPLWTNSYWPAVVGGAGDAMGLAVAADPNGNVIVAGDAYDDGTTWITSIKYSSSGVALRTNRFVQPGSFDGVTRMALDGNGNVFVTGTAQNQSIVTIGYSNTGEGIWTNFCNYGPGAELPCVISTDPSGNVFVAGTTDYEYFFLVKYSNSGTAMWTNSYLSGAGTHVSLATSPQGDAYLAGKNRGLRHKFFTIKYSAAGAGLWTRYYEGPSTNAAPVEGDGATALAVGANGDVYVTGYSENDPQEDSSDYATIKYSSDGTALWTNRYSLGDDDRPTALAVDRNGNAWVTGRAGDSFAPEGYDYATVVYSSAGVPLWTNIYDFGRNDQASSIAVHTDGSAYVTGYSRSQYGSYDFATIKYSGVSAPAIRLQIQSIGNQVVLSWTNPAFGLQTAPTITGTFTNISGATSPYTNSVTGNQKIFRLEAN